MAHQVTNRHIHLVTNNLKFIILDYLAAKKSGILDWRRDFCDWSTTSLSVWKVMPSRHLTEYNTLRDTVLHRRRSQGGQRPTPQFLENIVILGFERRFSKQNSVIRLKSSILTPPKMFGPQQTFGLATPLFYTRTLNTNQ